MDNFAKKEKSHLNYSYAGNFSVQNFFQKFSSQKSLGIKQVIFKRHQNPYVITMGEVLGCLNLRDMYIYKKMALLLQSCLHFYRKNILKKNLKILF